MRTNWKLVALAAAFLMLVAPAFGATAASKAKIHHRHYVAGQAYYPVPAGIMVSGTPLVGDTARTRSDGIIVA